MLVHSRADAALLFAEAARTTEGVAFVAHVDPRAPDEVAGSLRSAGVRVLRLAPVNRGGSSILRVLRRRRPRQC